jgi:hypothetical protein
MAEDSAKAVPAEPPVEASASDTVAEKHVDVKSAPAEDAPVTTTTPAAVPAASTGKIEEKESTETPAQGSTAQTQEPVDGPGSEILPAIHWAQVPV